MKCADFDTAFKAAEQEVSDSLIKKKFKLRNAYWGKVKDGGSFPRNAGTDVKKLRLSRIGFGKFDVGWESITDNGCDTNLCAQPERETLTRGWEESFYSIERFGIKSDDICLSVLSFRDMPETELAHYEEGLRDMVKYHWEEYAKSRQIHLGENKMVFVVPDDLVESDGSCDIIKTRCFPNQISDDGFRFWRRNAGTASTVTGDGPIDERYISVNVDPTKIANISELTIDMLDVASERLELEEENFRFLDEGIEMFDVVLPNARMGSRLAQLERLDEGSCIQTVYDSKQLVKTLGTKRVFRDRYSCRYDSYAPRFYPDTVYNATISGDYTASDPETWPRFVRVFPMIQRRNPNGTVKWVVNPDYTYAPFAITVVFTPTVFSIRGFPETMSVGSAKLGEIARNYAGNAVWINEYDKACNPRKEIGHWEVDFGAAAEPDRPENGYSYFHRVDHTLKLVNDNCAIREMQLNQQMTTYCYGDALSGETIATGERGANVVDHVNSQKFFW